MARKKHSTATAEAPRAKKTPLVSLRPMVDFPQQGDTIRSREYTVRVGAPQAARAVEVSFNQGPWQPCRPAEGYWWYDWTGFQAGEHEVVARAIGADGASQRSEPHEFFVEF